MTTFAPACFALGALTAFGLLTAAPSHADESTANPLLYAVAWKQTAAEYRAL